MAAPLANILVVDDTEAICKALRDVLMMAGYGVRTAPSGERALQILETASMDLVITDLKMSGISGIQLLKKVKEKSPATPVIILTGFGDSDSVVEAMHLGVADYLKKPFSVDEVLQVTSRELAKARQAPAPEAVAAPSTDLTEPPAHAPAHRFLFSTQDGKHIEKVLSELRAQTTAESVLLIEDTGYLISSKGLQGDTDLPSLGKLIVSSRRTTSQLAALLREEATFSLTYVEGQRVAVYTAGTSQGLALVVIVPKTVKQGAVWVYAKKAASEIEQLAANVVVQANPSPAAPVLALERKSGPTPVAEPKPQPAPVEQKPAPVEPAPEPEIELLTEETLETAAEPGESVQTLSWEEAIARGLLGDLKL